MDQPFRPPLWQRLMPNEDFANAEKVASAADFIFKSIHDKVRGRMNWLVGGVRSCNGW
jgi:hypothetical protein